MKPKLLLVTATLFFILNSCHRKQNEDKLSQLQTEIAPDELDQLKKPIPKNIPTPENLNDTATLPRAIKQTIDWDKKIIKNATLNIEVTNFRTFSQKVHETIKQFGGYVAQEEQNLSNEKLETVVTLKVPVAQFDDVINQLPNADSKILERKITSEDVTGQVIDTKSRLEAKKQMRLKYLDFLKQSKNMEEVLQVQGEINSIQEEIEAATGRISYLTNQAAFSTIHLTYFQPQAGFKPTDENPSFGTRTINSFKTGMYFLTEVFIGLMAIWPILFIVFAIWYFTKKSKAKRPRLQV
jgi:hypothetical protein